MTIKLYNLFRLFLLTSIIGMNINNSYAQCPYTFGNSLHFNGSGHNGPAITCGNDASTNIAGALTLEAWVNFSGLNSSCNVIMARTNAGTSDGGYALFINSWGTSDAKIVFETYNGALATNSAIPLNEWHHVAVSASSATAATIYIDGVAQTSTGTVNLTSNTTESFSIGAMGSGAYCKFNGKIDDVRVWNYSRTTAQVQTDMYNTRLGAWVGLVASYDFNVGTPNGTNTGLTTLRDSSGYANHGTLNGFTLSGATANWTHGNLVITGNQNICAAATSQLTHNISGGTWSTSNANVATVSSTGLVTGVSGGSATITYTFSWYGCTTKQSTFVVNVSGTSWTKLYETVNPSRDGSGSIVYTSGFGKTGGAASAFSGTFTRVKYRMENNVAGTLRWAEVSFDKWTGLTVAGIQIPDDINNYKNQRNVFNIEVSSNMPGVNTGRFDSGRVEMWPHNYYPTVSGLLPAGNTSTYDWDDTYDNNTNGHGSFQIHNITNGYRQTILAWNMHRNGGPAENGFGNSPSGDPDWTFNTSSGTTNFKVQIFVGTPTLSWFSGSTNQSVCSGAPIVPIVYAYTTGMTNYTINSLPTGLFSSIDTANKRITISGNPTTASTFKLIANGLCTNDTVSAVISLTAAPTLAGASTVAVASQITITPSVTGGTWSSSDTSKAKVSSTGVVTGFSQGAVTISYAIPSGCISTKRIFVGTISVAHFDDMYAVSATNTSNYYTCSKGLSISGGMIVGGNGNGDPGNWDLLGSNGSAFLGSNSATDVVLTASNMFDYITFDLGASANQTYDFTVTSYNADNSVNSTQTVNFYGANNSTNGTFVNVPMANTSSVKSVRIHKNLGGIGWGLDNIQFATSVAGIAVDSIGGNKSICTGATTSLTAYSSVTTPTYKWYADSTTATVLYTGATYTTAAITATTKYYVTVTSVAGCVSLRMPVSITVNTTPTVTATTPASICGTGTVTLGATASAGTLNWYAAATGGTSLATGTSFTTPSISATTTYYVDATNTGCTTATRTAVIATVNTIPTVTATTPASICGTGTVTLGATASAGTLNWYAAATGGTSLATGTSYTTPSISATTTYYVDATNTGCTTATRTAVIATVNTTPTVTATTPAAICGTGTATLGATASAGTLNWYAAATGGTSLGTGTSFTTPSISATTTYYVDATNTGCTTATRTAVIATVNTIPTVTATTPAAICGTGTVTLGATASAGTLNWYAAATGGTSLGTGTSFTTPSISATTTYYVDATNTGCTTATRTAVIATVNTIPTVTATTPASICGTGTVTLGATASAGTLNWYAAATGGTSLATGTSFTTPSISATTTYYVDATNTGCTTATRTAVIATVNTTPTVTATTPANRCAAGTVILGATASAGTLNWYAAATGGTSLGTGTSFTTPSISATTTYYVDATNTGCTTATRTAVIATVNTIPTVTATTPAAICGTGTVTLGATASAGTLNWYAAATGGTSLATGTSFTTPSISATTTYYVDATNTGCTTATRTAVIATVNTIPTVTATTPASICGTGTVTIGATASAGTLNWYAAATGGTSLGTGTSFTTPSISATTTYYVDATNTGCTTATRTAVIATVNTIPTVTATTPAAICGTGTATLGATASAGTLNWYAAATGGTSLATGTSFTTPSISATTTYYVDATNTGCTTATRSAVIATVNTTPTVTATTPAAICGTGTATLGATASAGTLNWYAAATGGTSLATGTSFTTPSISATTTYYVDATNTGCTTATRTAVIATVNPNLTASVSASASSTSICGSAAITFTATPTNGGTTPAYQWKKNGVNVGTNSATYVLSGAVNGDSVYVVMTSNATPCLVNVTSNSNGIKLTSSTVTPSVAVVASPGTTICAGTSVTFTATATNGGTTPAYQWLKNGVNVGTNSTVFTTSSLLTNDTIKVVLTSNASCVSTTIATSNNSVMTVNSIPTVTATTPANRCGTGTVTLGATASAGTLNWYASATGGTSLGTGTSFTTSSISATTTYYVDATNTGCTTATRTAVIATVNAIPTVTATTPANRCGSGTVTLKATASAGAINWYAAATGGTSLATDTSFITPSISATTTYYVDATNTGCTTATRTAVIATVNAIPTVTATTPANRCGSGTVTLKATASAGAINWYAAATGGTILATDTSFTTPSISATTTYYVDATNTGCTTATRTAVIATVNTIPTVTATTPASICGTGTVTLGATASAGTLNWYAAATGGTSLATGTSFTTPSISATTTYYVDATNTGCTTATRTAVIATVNTTPTVTATTPANRCAAGTVILGATASAGTLNWYAAATGGTSLGTGTSFTTPSISATTTYYVDATNTGCTTATRTAVIATINAKPVTSTISGRTSVHKDTLETYSVTNTIGSVYNWFITGGIKLSGGTTNSIVVRWDSSYTSGTVKVVETSLLGCKGDTVVKSIISIVPVELLSFDVKRNQTKAELTWVTASELNNDRFEIERSLDNRSFEYMGTVKGHGTTLITNNYNYTDDISRLLNTGLAFVYYRLKQVDYNGKYEYTPVRSVKLDEELMLDMQALPNPSNGKFTVKFTSLENKEGVLKVYDSKGALIWSNSVKLAKGVNEQLINLDLSQGIYNILFDSGEDSQTIRVIIK